MSTKSPNNKPINFGDQIELLKFLETLISPIGERVASLEIEVMELRAKLSRPEMPARLLRAREAAAMMGVAETSIYRYVKEGLLPNLGVGSTVRVAAKDLLVIKNHNNKSVKK